MDLNETAFQAAVEMLGNPPPSECILICTNETSETVDEISQKYSCRLVRLVPSAKVAFAWGVIYGDKICMSDTPI